ncbi:hypothetical protein D9M72_553900 [compost metagenome]
MGTHSATCGKQQCGGTVINPGCIASGHRAVAFKRRSHLRQLFQSGFWLHVLIGVDDVDSFARRDFDRNNLLSKPALGYRLSSALMAFKGQCVLHFSRDVLTLSNSLSSQSHVRSMKRIMQYA